MQEWQEDALCAEVDPEIFFPDRGGSSKTAKAICRTCPVAVECLEYALETDQGYGVWGATTEADRRRLGLRLAS
jgi:WhiB family redox-sensing transcriptional regulator